MNIENQPYTTHRLLRKFNACQERYDFLKTWAGDRADDDPIYLFEILEKNGIADATWAFRALKTVSKWRPLFVEFAVREAKNTCDDPTWGRWAASAARAAWAASAARAASAASAACLKALLEAL